MTKVRRRLTGVFQHRDHDPKRRRREHDRDQERRFRDSDTGEHEPDRECQHERENETEAGNAEETTAQLVELDLEAGEEQQEREPDQRHHLDGPVEVHPTKAVRPDRDSEHDLEHDRRQTHGRREAEHERRNESDGCDDREPGERQSHTAPSAETNVVLHRCADSGKLVSGSGSSVRRRSRAGRVRV